MEYFIIALGIMLIVMGCHKTIRKKEIQMGLSHAGAGVAVIMLSIFSLPDTEDIDLATDAEVEASGEEVPLEPQNGSGNSDTTEDEYALFLNEQTSIVSELTNSLEQILTENTSEIEDELRPFVEDLDLLAKEARDYEPSPSFHEEAYAQHLNAIERLEQLSAAQSDTIGHHQAKDMLRELAEVEMQLQQAAHKLKEE